MADVLAQGFEQDSYRVTVARDGEAGLELASKHPFDAIVMDVMLPVLDGCAVAGRLRDSGVATPILMLTALDAVQDVVRGLDAGAEDYLTKPFSFLELAARVRSLIRRRQKPVDLLAVADLTLDTAAHEVRRGGRTLVLTPTEFLLLQALMRNAGSVVLRQRLAEAGWGAAAAVDQNNLDACISSLRAKVDRDFPERLIHTIRGFGYKVQAAHQP